MGNYSPIGSHHNYAGDPSPTPCDHRNWSSKRRHVFKCRPQKL